MAINKEERDKMCGFWSDEEVKVIAKARQDAKEEKLKRELEKQEHLIGQKMLDELYRVWVDHRNRRKVSRPRIKRLSD